MAKKMTVNGKELKIKLVEESGGIALRVVKVDGEEISDGYIVAITTNGELERYSFVNTDLGLKLNGDYQIELERN